MRDGRPNRTADNATAGRHSELTQAIAHSVRFSGIFTPLVTPIHEDETPDLASLERLVSFQLDAGVHGFWAMGTSSEFASFDEHERATVIETVVRAASGRVPVIANISDAATRLAIRHALRAAQAGASAIAATPPYYYPHSQDELIRHYSQIRNVVELPLFIYNIPQTVRVRVELRTAFQLASQGVTVGIKDSQNDLEWFRQLSRYVIREGLDFALFAGTRFLIDAAVVAGATGAIPSVANAFPGLCVQAYEAARNGDMVAAAQAETRIMEAESPTDLLPLGSRNAAVLGLLKMVLFRGGIIASPELTAPLRSMTPEERHRIGDALENVRLSAVGQ